MLVAECLSRALIANKGIVVLFVAVGAETQTLVVVEVFIVGGEQAGSADCGGILAGEAGRIALVAFLDLDSLPIILASWAVEGAGVGAILEVIAF